MKEATFLAMLSKDIEKEIGGKVFKISDRSTLGLPDSMHLKEGFVTYIETKIGEVDCKIDGLHYVKPWKSIKKNIRQFEVCKIVDKHALMLYVIYYPEIKSSLVISIKTLKAIQDHPDATCNSGSSVKTGRGVDQLKIVMAQYKKEIHEKFTPNN